MELISSVTSIDFHMGSPVYPDPFSASVPFAWEDRPGVPNPRYKFLEKDFAFDVSVEFSADSAPAEELFHGGVIKVSDAVVVSVEFSADSAPKTGSSSSSLLLSSSRSRRTQSFSTRRGWEVPWEDQDEKEIREKQVSPMTNNIKPQLGSSLSTLSASSSTKGSRKWSLKDLFLFRSASDGRAMDRDPLKKYSAFFRKRDEDLMGSSVRPRVTHGSGSGSVSKRRGPVSAHELHYTINRAVANAMKKKTFLPYKQGILGRSAVNSSVHALSNGFGVSNNNRE